MAETQQKKPKYSGRVQVKVKQAANLTPKKWNGSVDSYCILKIGQTNRTTKTLIATPCPEWNQAFTLHVVYPFSQLELVVWDKALTGTNDVFLGQVTIPLSDLSEYIDEPIEKWYRLRGRDAEEDQEVGGEVELRIQYEYINSWIVVYEAISVYKAGEFQRATELLDQAMGIVPDCVELLSYRSSAFLQLRDFDEALKLAEEMIDSWPGLPDGYLRKGQVLYVNNMYEEARAVFHVGLQQNSKHQELLQNLQNIERNELRREIKILVEKATEAFEQKEYENALAAFSMIIPKDPNNYLFYLSRAMVSMTLGNTSDAKMDITKSVELEQTWPKRQVTKQGYLKKEGEVNRMMKKRWFILNRSFLFYYRSSKDLVPLGVVCLDEMIEKKGKWIGFQSLGRTYLLMAETPIQGKEWRLALKTATQKTLTLPEEIIDGDDWTPNQNKKVTKAKFRPGNVMLTLTTEEGYLYKLGNINRTWVQRWFIIKGTAVYYFDYKQVDRSVAIPCKGAILLEGATVRNVQRSEILGQGIAVPIEASIFAITIAGEQIYLYAENEEDREMWKEAVKNINKTGMKGKFPSNSAPLPAVTETETELSIAGSVEEEEEESLRSVKAITPKSSTPKASTPKMGSSRMALVENTPKEEENDDKEKKEEEESEGGGEPEKDMPGSLMELQFKEEKRERRNHSLSIATVNRKKKAREKLRDGPSAAESRYFADLGIGDMPQNTIPMPVPTNPAPMPGYGSVSESEDGYNSFDERMLGEGDRDLQTPLVPLKQKVHQEKNCCDSCVIL